MYIHQALCISAQDSFRHPNLGQVQLPEKGMLRAREPEYHAIDRNTLRRMTRSVRMSVAAAFAMAEQTGHHANDLVFATGTAGNEASMKFLQQMFRFEGGQLTPGDFIQSTPNAVTTQMAAAQAAMGYNMTHVHGGLSFENALLDAQLVLSDYPRRAVWVGGVDEQSDYGYWLNVRGGWYQDPEDENAGAMSPGTACIAGEGCALFTLSAQAEGSKAEIVAMDFFESDNPQEVAGRYHAFTRAHQQNQPFALMSGRTPEPRTAVFFDAMESQRTDQQPLFYFKPLCGEYPTAIAFGLWLCCLPAMGYAWPEQLGDRRSGVMFRDVCIINSYQASQHSLIWVRLPVSVTG